MNRIRAYGYALLVGSLLIASSMPIAFKLGSGIPAITLLFYISVVGTAVSFLVMIAKGSYRHLFGIFTNRNLFYSLAASGIFAFVFEPLALAYSTHYVTADLSAVVFRTWPIFLVLLSPFILREKITKWDIAGVLIGFFGLAVTLIGGTSISLPASELPFVAILLFAALSDALSTAITKRYTYDLTASVFVYNFISLAIFAPIAIYTNSWQLTQITSGVIFSIVFLGILIEAIYTFMFYEMFRLVKTSIASTSFIACSFITMVLSTIFLGEAIKPYYIIIAATVVAGVLVQKFAPKIVGNFITGSKGSFPLPIYDVTSAFINTKHPQIYQTMRGGGRVIAFYTEGRYAASITKEHLDKIGGDSCVLFSDKHHEIATQTELDFMRDIIGCGEEHLLIIGSGDPDKTTERFHKVLDLIGSGNYSSTQAVAT